MDGEAIRELREELGDRLLQVVFQAALTHQQGWFDIDGVVEAISEKLVRRHPWVFGDEQVDDASGAINSWEAISEQTHCFNLESALKFCSPSKDASVDARRLGHLL